MKANMDFRRIHEVFDKQTGNFVTKFTTLALASRPIATRYVMNPTRAVLSERNYLKSRTISVYHNLLNFSDKFYGYIDKNGVVLNFKALPGENGITERRGRRIPNGLPYGRTEYEPLTNYAVVVTLEFSSSLPKVTLTL